jgi:glycogen debranching enzyme
LAKPTVQRLLRTQAELLFRRFNEAFWDEESGFYAYALDCNKRKVLTVASNPGHCLWFGIVPADRAARVVKRLMVADTWNGWGIRTLSAENGAYNPYSYQNGSMWPHDNAIIALGFPLWFCGRSRTARPGREQRRKIFRRTSGARTLCGSAAGTGKFSGSIPWGKRAQAWAAGSVFVFLQAMLGLQPDAPSDMLHVDPSLPDWLPDLALRDMRIGKRQFSCASGETVRRHDGRCSAEKLTASPIAPLQQPRSCNWKPHSRPASQRPKLFGPPGTLLQA